MILDRIQSAISLKQEILADKDLIKKIEDVAILLSKSFEEGNKLFLCGNGGSAADAQHLAAEFSGRFYYDRPPLPAEAMHVNTSYITAVANDYSYDLIYSRYLESTAIQGDFLIGLSTSGNSKNVVEAFKKAKELAVKTIAFTGLGGGALAELADYLIEIPSTDTPRIQECHMLIGHILCEWVESSVFPKV
jgi:D-sedoheptulose 7-phosphate isomerase